MQMSKNSLAVIQQAVMYAHKNNFEYITPELILWAMCDSEQFREAFERCNGDAEQLKSDLDDYMNTYVEKVEDVEPKFSSGSAGVMQLAGHSASNSSRDTICLKHILYAIWQLEESYAVYYMRRQKITVTELLRAMEELDEEQDSGKEDEDENGSYSGPFDQDDDEEDYEGPDSKKNANGWLQFAPCMNDMIQDRNPLIGREEELERTIQILCRKDKNNPLHLRRRRRPPMRRHAFPGPLPLPS